MRRPLVMLSLCLLIFFLGSCCTTPTPIGMPVPPTRPEYPERPDPPADLTDEELDYLISLADTILVQHLYIQEMEAWIEIVRGKVDAHNAEL